MPAVTHNIILYNNYKLSVTTISPFWLGNICYKCIVNLWQGHVFHVKLRYPYLIGLADAFWKDDIYAQPLMLNHMHSFITWFWCIALCEVSYIVMWIWNTISKNRQLRRSSNEKGTCVNALRNTSGQLIIMPLVVHAMTNLV